MAIEKERKYLVDANLLPNEVLNAPFFNSEAGYFTKDGVAIRVTMREGGKCKVCFKSPGGNETRHEFEYVIPREDAETLMELCPTRIKKTRRDYEGWEIDTVHLGDGRTMWMAEWEEKEGKPPMPLEAVWPKWLLSEVTNYIEYSMQHLAWKYGKK